MGILSLLEIETGDWVSLFQSQSEVYCTWWWEKCLKVVFLYKVRYCNHNALFSSWTPSMMQNLLDNAWCGSSLRSKIARWIHQGWLITCMMNSGLVRN